MADVTAIWSRHSIHVTERADVADVAGWSADALFAVVEAADPLDRVVVIDYGRDQLYLASEVEYEAPTALGLVDPAVLVVRDPLLAALDERGGTEPAVDLRAYDSPVRVSPEFDVLVPAFEWADEEVELLPPTDRRDRPRATRHGTPT